MPNKVNCFKTMKRHVDIMNTNSVDTINQVGVEIFMGFEGQIGSLPSWMNRTWTKFDERPWMANTLQAHKGNNKQNALNVAAFRYGNKNYRQIAMMNSVTLRQVRDPRTLSSVSMKSEVGILIKANAWEEANPDTPWIERVFELYKNTYVGRWTIHHQQR